MATKGKLTPYDDIQTRQVNPNMSEGLLGSNVPRQQMASAKNLGEAGFEIADKIAAYGRKRQAQKDLESGFQKLELLNQQYEIILDEEKNREIDPAFNREHTEDSQLSLTKRVQDRMNDTHANFLETNTFTQGERDMFNIGAAKARIQLGSRAFDAEKAQDRVHRSLNFEYIIESASTRAFGLKNSKAGLDVFKDMSALLDSEYYPEKTRAVLRGKLSNIALSTAHGLVLDDPGQLIKDLKAKLYNGILDAKQINSLRKAAQVELNRKNSGSDAINTATANGQIQKILNNEITVEAANAINWHNEDNKKLHDLKMKAAGTVADFLQGMGSIAKSDLMENVAAYEEIKKGSDDISRGFYSRFDTHFYNKIKDFEEAMANDPIGSINKYNPGLFQQLSEMNTGDAGYIKALDDYQADQHILSGNRRITSNAELKQMGNDLSLTKKNISVKELRNHGSTDQIRKGFEQILQKYGPDNYGRVIGELQLNSKDHSINEVDIIASAYIKKPDLFALIIKTGLMKKEDWVTLGETSGAFNSDELEDLTTSILQNDGLKGFINQIGQFQKPARLAQAMTDVGRALAYLHGTTEGIPEKVEEMFLEGTGRYKLQTQGGKTHSIFFSREITDKEGFVFYQNMTDSAFFFKQGARFKIPNMTTQLTAAFYANMVYPCPTTNGDGKYNLCVFDEEAAGQPQRRLLTRSNELLNVDESAFFTPMDTTRSRLEQGVQQWGKRNEYSLMAGMENALKAAVFLNRWSAEKQREFLDSIGIKELSLENAHKVFQIPDTPPDAYIKPLGVDTRKILAATDQKRLRHSQGEAEAKFVGKRNLAIGYMNQMRNIDFSKAENPDAVMNQFESSTNDLIEFADISQTIDPNKRRHFKKLFSDIRTAASIQDDKGVKQGMNKVELELKYLFGQTVTDGNLSTPLTAMRTQIIRGILVKTPAELNHLTGSNESTKPLTLEQAKAKLEELHGLEDTDFMVKQNIQSLKDSGEEFTDMEGVTHQKRKTVEEKIDTFIEKGKKILTKPIQKALSKKESARFKDLMNKQTEYTRLSGKKKSQFGAGSKKPKDLSYFEKQELKRLSERYQKNFEWNQKHGVLPPSEG